MPFETRIRICPATGAMRPAECCITVTLGNRRTPQRNRAERDALHHSGGAYARAFAKIAATGFRSLYIPQSATEPTPHPQDQLSSPRSSFWLVQEGLMRPQTDPLTLGRGVRGKVNYSFLRYRAQLIYLPGFDHFPPMVRLQRAAALRCRRFQSSP